MFRPDCTIISQFSFSSFSLSNTITSTFSNTPLHLKTPSQADTRQVPKVSFPGREKDKMLSEQNLVKFQQLLATIDQLPIPHPQKLQPSKSTKINERISITQSTYLTHNYDSNSHFSLTSLFITSQLMPRLTPTIQDFLTTKKKYSHRHLNYSTNKNDEE